MTAVLLTIVLAAPAMNSTELRALLRLRDAQPRPLCGKLATWIPDADPCSSWDGITCTDDTGEQQRRVAVLDIRYCGIVDLPAEVLVWERLEVLEARGNAIASLPSSISRLSRLRKIFVEMNLITELPRQLCDCTRLTNLYVAYNSLTALPACIGDMVSLYDIWLRGNSIATLPESFCKLGRTTGFVDGYMMESGLTKLPECIGQVPFETLFLDGNQLTEVPDGMSQLFTVGGLRHLRLARNRLTAVPSWAANGSAVNITSINLEDNLIRELPVEVPWQLQSLRLGGNPLTGLRGAHGINRLSRLLEMASASLVDLTIGISEGGTGQLPWDGMRNDYVVAAMPDLRQGLAVCPAGGLCPFTIQTDWNFDNYASGGLDLSYCLNASTGCGCEHSTPASAPPSCIALRDHHNGSYSGAIDGRTVGTESSSSFRFFQRASSQGDPIFEEVVVGMWADGSACVGARPDAHFQSRGGNCFRGVRFA